MDRAIFYIDGFNVYHGLKDAIELHNWGNYKWLDYQKLAENLILDRRDIDLITIKYFTARKKNDPDKVKRQSDYLEVLHSLPKIKVYYGNYKKKCYEDKITGQIHSYYVEKMTDVNIATQLLLDAFNNKCDIAYVVSGDSDLLPAFEAIRNEFQNLTLVACFPPRRSLIEITAICHHSRSLKERHFKKSLLPNTITINGNIIQRPSEWY